MRRGLTNVGCKAIVELFTPWQTKHQRGSFVCVFVGRDPSVAKRAECARIFSCYDLYDNLRNCLLSRFYIYMEICSSRDKHPPPANRHGVG